MAQTVNIHNEEHLNYLREVLGEHKVSTFLLFEASSINKTSEDQEIYKTVKKCLDLMEKFTDNPWWLSEDKRVLAYYQLMNPTLLVTFSKFHKALEHLLGRPVWTHEMGLNYEGLKDEAERAFNGNQDSEEKRAESIKSSFDQLANSGIPAVAVVIE